MKKGWGIIAWVVFGLFFMVSTAPAATQTFLWKCGSIQAPTSINGEYLTLFAKKVDEKTKGAMKIQIGFNSAFGGLKELVPAVSMGSVDIHIESQNWWDTIDKNRRIYTFPYTFSSWDHMTAFVKSPLWDEQVKKLDTQNIHMVFPDPKNPVIYKQGPTRVILSKKPIYTAKDLEGLKLRLYESELAKRVWKHMGCNITVIAWAEAYLALKQGMVEGITSPLNMVYDTKLHEVAPYITDINEFLQFFTMVVNKPKWDKLPPAIQKAMIDSVNEVALQSNDQLYKRVESDIQKMTDEGAFYIRTSLKSFKEKIAPLAREMENEDQWRAGLFDDIQKLKP
jgi:TRAP-type transport system periplasmic protein